MYTLTRTQSDDTGTLGVITDKDGKKVCCTVELPWRNNDHQTSCIPHGTYHVTRYMSPTKGRVFLVNDVPNRTMIEIHAGNTMHDVIGCIAVGGSFGVIDGMPAVFNSKITLAELIADMPTSFDLTVTGIA